MCIQEYRATGGIVSGYMLRGYNCGFIYGGGSERTVAHELGHGIAGLEHVFENFDTGIEIEPNDAPKTNPDCRYYYISKAANENYKDPNKKTK